MAVALSNQFNDGGGSKEASCTNGDAAEGGVRGGSSHPTHAHHSHEHLGAEAPSPGVPRACPDLPAGVFSPHIVASPYDAEAAAPLLACPAGSQLGGTCSGPCCGGKGGARETGMRTRT